MKKLSFMAVLLVTGFVVFAQELPRLAVVEFTTNISTEKATADSVTVRNLVESQMVGTGKYQIIARGEIDKLLENQQIAVSSISSDENIKKLQLENISYIVTGSVDAMGSDYAVTVKMLDVSTGQFSHSINDFMGGGSRELFTGVNTLVANFVKGMSSEGGTVGQVAGQRLRSEASEGIGIEVSTKRGGVLYFQEKEIAALWDNDTYTIPIERPGIYSIKFISGKTERVWTVTINTRGVTKLDTSLYVVGDTGPAGGIVFYDTGNDSGGWRYLEAAPASTEFKATWNGAPGICGTMNVNGLTEWRLPTKNELNLMYVNLKQKGLGNFQSAWYWSSLRDNYGAAWVQDFSDGRQKADYLFSDPTYSVRAVRAF